MSTTSGNTGNLLKFELKYLLKILEISWNLIAPPGNFFCNRLMISVFLLRSSNCLTGEQGLLVFFLCLLQLAGKEDHCDLRD